MRLKRRTWKRADGATLTEEVVFHRTVTWRDPDGAITERREDVSDHDWENHIGGSWLSVEGYGDRDYPDCPDEFTDELDTADLKEDEEWRRWRRS